MRGTTCQSFYGLDDDGQQLEEGQGPEDGPDESHHQRGDQAHSKQPVQPRWGGGQPEPTQSKIEVEIFFFDKLKHLQILFLRRGWVVFLAACLLRRRIRFRSGEFVANQRCMGKV